MIANIIGLLLAAAGLYLIGRVVLRLVTIFRSLNWPTTVGKVTKSTWKQDGYDETKSFSAVVHASYSVGGQVFEVHLKEATNANTLSKRAAQRQAKRYKRGTEVPIRYNPDTPEEAVLSSNDFVKIAIAETFGGLVVLALGMYIFVASG